VGGVVSAGAPPPVQETAEKVSKIAKIKEINLFILLSSFCLVN
jgi:hypothetical protein